MYKSGIACFLTRTVKLNKNIFIYIHISFRLVRLLLIPFVFTCVRCNAVFFVVDTKYIIPVFVFCDRTRTVFVQGSFDSKIYTYSLIFNTTIRILCMVILCLGFVCFVQHIFVYLIQNIIQTFSGKS